MNDWESLVREIKELIRERERLLEANAQLERDILQCRERIQYLERIVDRAATLGEPFLRVCFEGGVDRGDE